MQVLDHEPHSWFLFEANGALYLDANCNHGAFGYSFMIRLSAAEVQRYRDEGRDYLSWLAQDIHNSAPILSASSSPYKVRKAAPEEEAHASMALAAWQAERIRRPKLGV
ncbi:hypothetical protein R20233_00099 [Ralstonia sp. LMG 32965]|uniref:hypothetical protein n=1 Tax=Ralstonia flatus TaxID=3058601 RepID=UPI0028F58DBC|nr:hypothetical protein [Ralstonia sp. LMG 32965]CAJ0853055.1 hypothetical protein R20233_00099 [Ralstonia sp. LMG 32965]